MALRVIAGATPSSAVEERSSARLIDGLPIWLGPIGGTELQAARQPFVDLRRRRNELEYPRLPADTASEDEATQAIELARKLIAAAKVLLGQLSLFAQQ
jgi:hypothetical protein